MPLIKSFMTRQRVWSALAVALLALPVVTIAHAERESTVPTQQSLSPQAVALLAHLTASGVAVDLAHFSVSVDEEITTGDLELFHIVATVNSAGKEVDAYLQKKTLRVVSLHRPTYLEASGGKLTYEGMQALSDPVADDALRFVVYVKPPSSAVLADQVLDPVLADEQLVELLNPNLVAYVRKAKEGGLTNQEFVEYREEVRARMNAHNQATMIAYLASVAERIVVVDGITSVDVGPGSPRMVVTATPEGIRRILEMPEVTAVDALQTIPMSTRLGVSRQAGGVKPANDLGYDGFGMTATSLDTGVNSLVLGGRVCNLIAGSRDYSNDDSGTDDDLNHGTSVAWIINGNRDSNGNLCAYIGSDPLNGMAMRARVYNAKVLGPDGKTNNADYDSALFYGFSETASHVVTTSVGPPTADDGTSWMSTHWDYYTYAYNTLGTVAPGNTPSRVEIPGGAYNILSVGASDDRNTPGTGDDGLYGNTPTGPTPDSRAKPDLVFPGTNIDVLDANGNLLVPDDGTSLATPHAAGAALTYSSGWSGRERKCALIASTTGSWQSSWAWGAAYSEYGRIPNTMQTASVGHTGWWTTPGNAFQVNAGKTVYGALIWYREMVNGVTVSRFSDLDLYLWDAVNNQNLDWSTDTRNSVEVVSWTNNDPWGGTAFLRLKVNGWSVPGGTAQPFTVCLDIR